MACVAMSDEDVLRARSRDLGSVEPTVSRRLLRLLPLHGVDGDTPRRPPPPLSTGGEPRAPRVVLRVGASDYEAVSAVIGHHLRPAAVAVALSEKPAIIAAAGRAARRAGVPFGTDPVFFRCVLDGVRRPQTFARLSYAPAPDAGPWRNLSPAAWRQLARAAVEEQIHREAGLLFSATVPIAGPADPALEIAVALLEATIAARAAWGNSALIAPIIIDLRQFLDLASQRRLVRRLAAQRPEAFLVHLDGLHAGARPQTIAAALRLLLLLQEAAAPVLLGRAGALRRLANAYELAGYEVGMGRLDRFALSDFRGSGGGGPKPAKLEVPELVTALPPALVRQAVLAGVLPEADDGDPDPIARNARVVSDEALGAARRTPAQRRALLRDDLVAAGHLAADLAARDIDVSSYTGPLRTWAKAMEIADAWGLHDIARLRASLRDVA